MGGTHFSGPVYAGGEALTSNPQQAAIADITTDMSFDPNDNELKGKINAILAALRAAKIIDGEANVNLAGHLLSS